MPRASSGQFVGAWTRERLMRIRRDTLLAMAIKAGCKVADDVDKRSLVTLLVKKSSARMGLQGE